MKRNIFVLIPVLCLIQVSLAWSQVHPDSLRQQVWQQFRQQNGTGWRIRWNRKTGLPASLMLGETKPYPGTPKQAARAFLKDHTRLFDFRADLSDLQPLRKRYYHGVHYITYQETYKNLPVKGAEYVVHVGKKGNVEMANGRYYPDISLSVHPSLDSTAAIRTSEARFPVPASFKKVHSSRLVIYPAGDGKTFYLAWKVHLWAPKAGYNHLFYVNARSGKLLEQVNLIFDIIGSGSVYPTTPDLSSPTTENLNDLDGSGYLRGTYANVLNEQASRAYSSNNSFVYAPSNTHFDEVNVYKHITQFRSEFINPMDYGNQLPLQQITAYVHDTQYTNSVNAEFNPSNQQLYFGDGSASATINDFAKSDKVIYHEYTHAVTYYIDSDIVSSSDETGAISEGDADYFAGSYAGRAIIGDYVAPSQERDMNNPAISTYSDYQSQEPVNAHKGGEFWSSVLWALRNDPNISAAQANQDVYSAIYGVTGAPDFLEFRDAMMSADQDFYGGAHVDLIQNVFASKGIGTPATEPLSVSISGPLQIHPYTYVTWTANASGGTSPYQYSWQYRYTCRSYGVGCQQNLEGVWQDGPNQQAIAFFFYPGINTMELWVTVTDADDHQVWNIKTVYMTQANTLADPSPNPFNPTTVLRYSLAKPAHVRLTIYNILGRKVATLVNADQTAGKYSKTFNAGNLATGTYFERLTLTDKSGKVTQLTKKLLLLK